MATTGQPSLSGMHGALAGRERCHWGASKLCPSRVLMFVVLLGSRERFCDIVDGRARIRNRGVKCRDSDLHGRNRASSVGLGGVFIRHKHSDFMAVLLGVRLRVK